MLSSRLLVGTWETLSKLRRQVCFRLRFGGLSRGELFDLERRADLGASAWDVFVSLREPSDITGLLGLNALWPRK